MDSALSWTDTFTKTTAPPYFSHLPWAFENFQKIATVLGQHLISIDPAQQQWHEVTEFPHLHFFEQMAKGGVLGHQEYDQRPYGDSEISDLRIG